MKKQVQFANPLYIKQGIKISTGEYQTVITWDIFTRAIKWFGSLLPKITKVEIGSETIPVREAYFWIGENGQLEARQLPQIDEETEELIKNTALAIEINERQGSEFPAVELKLN